MFDVILWECFLVLVCGVFYAIRVNTFLGKVTCSSWCYIRKCKYTFVSCMVCIMYALLFFKDLLAHRVITPMQTV